MKAWELFWELNLIVSGTAFAVITAIVAVRGLADLKSMFASLSRQKKERDSLEE